MRNNNRNKSHRKCTSKAQKFAIKRTYAERGHKAGQSPESTNRANNQGKQAAQSPGANDRSQQPVPDSAQKFPDKYPFWARLKISKNRTTLVIDEDDVRDKKTKKLVDGFVHREATSEYHNGFEEIKPNPDKDKRPNPMYLKSPRKLPKYLFNPHNKQLDMPEHLRERYDKNNHKCDNNDGNN